MTGKVTIENLIQHELIGLQTRIISAPSKELENISGKIVDETMNTFKIEYMLNNKIKTITVPKSHTTFRFDLQVGTEPDNPQTDFEHVDIDGTLLTKRPEDRIKKLARIVKNANRKNK